MKFATCLQACSVLILSLTSALHNVRPKHKKAHHVTNTDVSMSHNEFCQISPDDSSDRDKRLLGFAGINGTGGNEELEKWYQKLEQNLKDHNCVITEGHSNGGGNREEQRITYSKWAESGNLGTVCETGFNAGHSALRFLALSKAHVYEFDIGEHDYAHTSAEFLTASFPERLTVTWGDSTKTVPEFYKSNPNVKCDLIITDGGHSYEVALADLKNFMPMASENHILAIDDTPCNQDFCKGPTSAWEQLMKAGCINEAQATTLDEGHGFRFGKYMPCSI